MTKRRITGAVYSALLLVIVLTAGCGDDPAPPRVPGIQPEIVNSVDNFQFQVTAIENYTGTLVYAWQNTGTMADVNQSCAVTSGTVDLVIDDDGSTQVYSNDLSQDGTYVTDTGTAGSWAIRVVLTGASGTLNFRVDKRPAP